MFSDAILPVLKLCITCGVVSWNHFTYLKICSKISRVARFFCGPFTFRPRLIGIFMFVAFVYIPLQMFVLKLWSPLSNKRVVIVLTIDKFLVWFCWNVYTCVKFIYLFRLYDLLLLSPLTRPPIWAIFRAGYSNWLVTAVRRSNTSRMTNHLTLQYH